LIEQLRVDARHFLALDGRNRLTSGRHGRRWLQAVIAPSWLGTALEADGNTPGYCRRGRLPNRSRLRGGGLEGLFYGCRVNARGREVLNLGRRSVDHRQRVESGRLLNNDHPGVGVTVITDIEVRGEADVTFGARVEVGSKSDVIGRTNTLIGAKADVSPRTLIFGGSGVKAAAEIVALATFSFWLRFRIECSAQEFSVGRVIGAAVREIQESMRVGSVVGAGNRARQRIRLGIVSLWVRRPGRLRRLVQPGLLGRLHLRRVDIGYSARSEYVVEGRITLAHHDTFTNLDGFTNLDAFRVVRLDERLY
jgi:hypothetical protein